jgi:hypothetical protein
VLVVGGAGVFGWRLVQGLLAHTAFEIIIGGRNAARLRRRDTSRGGGADRCQFDTPALSNAVLDRLTTGWRLVGSVAIAISPGNRAPRGLSMVRSILSYAGRPVRCSPIANGALGQAGA